MKSNDREKKGSCNAIGKRLKSVKITERVKLIEPRPVKIYILIKKSNERRMTMRVNLFLKGLILRFFFFFSEERLHVALYLF